MDALTDKGGGKGVVCIMQVGITLWETVSDVLCFTEGVGNYQCAPRTCSGMLLSMIAHAVLAQLMVAKNRSCIIDGTLLILRGLCIV